MQYSTVYYDTRGQDTTSTSDIPSPLTPNILSQPQILRRKKETFILSSKMHLYSSQNSYYGEYLKREKCIIDLQEVICICYLSARIQHNPTFHSFSLFQTSRCRPLFRKVHLVTRMGQYSECNRHFFTFQTHKKIPYRDSSDSTSYTFLPSVLNGQF